MYVVMCVRQHAFNIVRAHTHTHKHTHTHSLSRSLSLSNTHTHTHTHTHTSKILKTDSVKTSMMRQTNSRPTLLKQNDETNQSRLDFLSPRKAMAYGQTFQRRKCARVLSCFAIPLKLTAGQLKTLMGKLLTTLLLTPNIPKLIDLKRTSGATNSSDVVTSRKIVSLCLCVCVRGHTHTHT
jgi:hypothetical protein